MVITQVSCGAAHTAFISSKHSFYYFRRDYGHSYYSNCIDQQFVFTFGSNSDGQLGINDQALPFSTAPLLVTELVQ